jgi:hypothetical protein
MEVRAGIRFVERELDALAFKSVLDAVVLDLVD